MEQSKAKFQNFFDPIVYTFKILSLYIVAVVVNVVQIRIMYWWSIHIQAVLALILLVAIKLAMFTLLFKVLRKS